MTHFEAGTKWELLDGDSVRWGGGSGEERRRGWWGSVKWKCEKRKRQKEKKRKRGNNRDEKSEEEEEECVGSAPSLKDDSQLSLSTPVTRNEPRLLE